MFRVGADITVLREREVDYDSDEQHRIAEVLIRKVPDDQQVINSDVICVLCIASSKFMVINATKDLFAGRLKLNQSQFSLYMRGKMIRLCHHTRPTLKMNSCCSTLHKQKNHRWYVEGLGYQTLQAS